MEWSSGKRALSHHLCFRGCRNVARSGKANGMKIKDDNNNSSALLRFLALFCNEEKNKVENRL